MKKSKRSGNYGKRYTPDQIRSFLAKWRKNLASPTAISKSAFSSSIGVTTITLNKWLSEYASTTEKPGVVAAGSEQSVEVTHEPQQAAAITEVTVIELQPAATSSRDDDTARIVQAIRIRQAEIAQLKGQLLDIVKAL